MRLFRRRRQEALAAPPRAVGSMGLTMDEVDEELGAITSIVALHDWVEAYDLAILRARIHPPAGFNGVVDQYAALAVNVRGKALARWRHL